MPLVRVIMETPMPKIPVIALLALFCACGVPPDPPDFVTARGVSVYAHGHPLDRFDAGRMDAHIASYFPRPVVDRCMSRLSVGLFTQEEINLMYAAVCNGKCVENPPGYVDGSVAKIVAEPRTIIYANYMHELAHWLQICGYDAWDYDHDLEPELWNYVDTLSSTLSFP